MKKIIFTLLIMFTYLVGFSTEYKIFKAETGSEIPFSQLVDELSLKDVVFFGELHDDSLLHAIEADLLYELTKVDTNFVLGMESFARNDQTALDKYLSNEYSYEQLDANSNLWSNYQEAYSGLIDFAKNDTIKVLATNTPVYISGMVARQSFSALQKLSLSERKYYAREFKPFENDYKSMFFNEMQEMSNADPDNLDTLILERLYQAHTLKDDTMAESIFDYLEDNHQAKIFHINGDFHTKNHYGLYQKLELLNPNLEIASLSPLPYSTGTPLEWDYRLYGQAEYIIMYHRDEVSLPINDKADTSEFLAIDKHTISFIFEPNALALTVSDKITFNQKFNNNTLLLSKDIKDIQVLKGKEKVDFTLTEMKNDFNKIQINTSAKELTLLYIYDYPKNKARPFNFYLEEYKWHPVVSLEEKSYFEVNALGPDKMKFIAPAEATITPQRNDAIYYTWKSFAKEYGFSIIGDLYFTKSIEVNDVLITYYSFEDDFNLVEDYTYFTQQYFELYRRYFGDFGYDSYSIIQSVDHKYKSFDNMLLVANNIFKNKDIFITPGVLGHDLAKMWISSKCQWNGEGANWQEILANFVANYFWLEKNKPEDAYLWRKDALEDISGIPRDQIKSLHDFTFAVDKFSAVNGYKIGGMLLYYVYNKVGEAKFFTSINEILTNNENLSAYDFFNYLREKTEVEEVASFIDDIYPLKVYIREAEVNEAKTKFKIVSSREDRSNFDIEIKLSNQKNFVKTNYHINKKETVLEFNFDATRIEIDPEYKLYRYLDNSENVFNIKRTLLKEPLLLVDQESQFFSDIYNIGNTLRSNGVKIDMMPLSSINDIAWKEKSIFYIGEYHNNPVFNLFQPYLPPSFIFGKNKFTFEGKDYSQDKYSVVINTQNPFDINQSISMWLWNSANNLENINEIFNYTSPSWVILEFDGSHFQEIKKGNLIDEVLFPTRVNVK